MKRFHVHLHVADLPHSIAFYSKLFAAEPARLESDYAKMEDSDRSGLPSPWPQAAFSAPRRRFRRLSRRSLPCLQKASVARQIPRSAQERGATG